MFTVQLSDIEQELLAEVLDRTYRNLKEEIYKTETYAFKVALKDRERLLQGVIAKMTADGLSLAAA